jgi:hypothetical protein
MESLSLVERRRAVRQAVVATWTVGVLSLLPAVGTLMFGARWGNLLQQPELLLSAFIASLPGLGYVLAAVFIQRYHLWALILAVVIAALQLLAVLVVVVTALPFAAIVPRPGPALFTACFAGLIGVVLCWALYWLAASLKAMRMPPPPRIDRRRGFEPLLPQAVLPIEPPDDTRDEDAIFGAAAGPPEDDDWPGDGD